MTGECIEIEFYSSNIWYFTVGGDGDSKYAFGGIKIGMNIADVVRVLPLVKRATYASGGGWYGCDMDSGMGDFYFSVFIDGGEQ